MPLQGLEQQAKVGTLATKISDLTPNYLLWQYDGMGEWGEV